MTGKLQSRHVMSANKNLKRDLEEVQRQIQLNTKHLIPENVIDLEERAHLKKHLGGKDDCARCVDIWLRRAA